MRPSDALRRHRDAMRELLSLYPVANPRVFGSVARGEDTEKSDLDLLVETRGPVTYFDLARIEMELEKLTGVKISVHTPGEFGPKAKANIALDAKSL